GSSLEPLRKELGKTQALLVGPGLGTEKATADFVRRWLGAEEPVLARRGGFGFVALTDSAPEPDSDEAALPPLVLDADALRLIAEVENWPKRLPREAVLTPHPGEMAALTGLDKDAIQADRIGTAQKYAAEWGHVV